MDAAQRELSYQIDEATQRLLDDARTLNQTDLSAPSLLPGWDRGYVIAHVARVADVLRSLLIGARSGQVRPAHASARAAAASAEPGAAVRPEKLMTDLADSAMALRTVARQLPDDAWPVPVRLPGTEPFPAAQVLTRRLVEVELHHCDLGIGYSPANWPAAFADMDLPEPMRSQRQDRLGYASLASEQGARPPGRPPASWKPGQRLPGSWIGAGQKPAPS